MKIAIELSINPSNPRDVVEEHMHKHWTDAGISGQICNVIEKNLIGVVTYIKVKPIRKKHK